MIKSHTVEFWKIASGFPPDKETIYPDHAVAQEFDKTTKQFVLEYGCGGGSDTMSYLRRNNTVWFADIVPGNVKTTALRVREAGMISRAMPIFLADSAPIALGDSSMDVISSHGVIHHIEKPLRVLHEFHRILRPTGLIYIMLYTEKLFADHAATISRLVEENGLTSEVAFGWATDGEGCPYAKAYTEQEGRMLLAEAGFEVDRVFDYISGQFRTFRAKKIEDNAVKWRIGSAAKSESATKDE